MTKRKGVYPLIIASLVILFNPSANIIDVLPDCIAYGMLIYAISGIAATVPYLAECEGALKKLCFVTLIKIPAFIVMYSNMKYGSDIIPLFTLSFAAVEIILLRIALKNLFSALSYIGERTDCKSVREPFPVSKKRSISPDSLYGITFGFFVSKAALGVIPELLLLSREDFALKKELNEAYPTVLIFTILIALVLGAMWLKCAIAYARSIKNGGDLLPAIEYIKGASYTPESDAQAKEKRLLNALTLLAVSSLFTFDIAFKNFGGYNILPHFIYGIILFYAVYNLTSDKRARTWLTAVISCFSLASLVGQIFTVRFFDKYQYSDLSYSKYAKAAYLPIQITSVLETVTMVFAALICVKILTEFVKEHTEVSPSDPSYTASNLKAQRRLIKLLCPLPFFSAFISILKCINTFLNATVRVIDSEVNPDGIVTSGAPFMSTLIFLVTIVYVVYSFTVVSTVKDEVKLKYGE